MIDNTVQINSNDIEQNGLKWCSVDEIGKMLKIGNIFLVNTDLSSGPGIHWLCACCLVDGNQNVLYVVDPLGPENERPNDKVMLDIAHNNNYDVELYPHTIQEKWSVHCGYFSIVVAKLMIWLKKQNRLTIDDIEKETIKLFGRYADLSDEALLAQLFGLDKIV
jgi:hypothetical protein